MVDPHLRRNQHNRLNLRARDCTYSVEVEVSDGSNVRTRSQRHPLGQGGPGGYRPEDEGDEEDAVLHVYDCRQRELHFHLYTSPTPGSDSLRLLLRNYAPSPPLSSFTHPPSAGVTDNTPTLAPRQLCRIRSTECTAPEMTHFVRDNLSALKEGTTNPEPTFSNRNIKPPIGDTLMVNKGSRTPLYEEITRPTNFKLARVPGCIEDRTKGFKREGLDSVKIKLPGRVPQLYTVRPFPRNCSPADVRYSKFGATDMSAECDMDSPEGGHSPNITVDAIHPVFKAYRAQLADSETSTQDDLRFHCKQCQVYFPMRQDAVMHHFETLRHDPVESCIYCRGPVYYYFYNVSRNVYHKCVRQQDGRS
ncbi:hypothetical protein AAG570_000904 [Ranatra chinensis]|uniref:C2H2-type domain-containing protein n=1 Tax=Ranatra chinensis TaxID=642074 RepID=A0ABD0ZJP4_9HEMI